VALGFTGGRYALNQLIRKNKQSGAERLVATTTDR
jgi:hypothetical protein